MVAPTPSVHHVENGNPSPTHAAAQDDDRPRSTLKPVQPSPEDAPGALKTPRAASPEHEPATLAGQYSGPSSAYSFLRRAWRRFGLDANRSEEGEPHQTGVPIFNFGDKIVGDGEKRIPPVQLPSRDETQAMIETYFEFSMPTYRYLHKPTVAQWLETYHDQVEGREGAQLLPSRQAVVLMVMATALLFLSERHQNEPWRDSEPYFRIAQAKLAAETGKARLESVQARLAMCLYLLHTSRPNQSW